MGPDTDYSQIPLRGAHLPAEVSWWPPAIGWWLLAAIVVAVVVFAIVRYRRLHLRRVALRALGSTLNALQAGEEPVFCLQRVSSVLRRFAMSVAPDRAAVAGLVGPAWLGYLDSRWDSQAFAAKGQVLTQAPYAPAHCVSESEAIELTTLCIDWVRAQRVGR